MGNLIVEFGELIQRMTVVAGLLMSDWLNVLLITVVTLVTATITAARNHLNYRRARNTTLFLLSGLVGWMTLGYRFIPMAAQDNEAFATMVFTVILTTSVIGGTWLAAFLLPFLPDPVQRARSYLALLFLGLAEMVADGDHIAMVDAQKCRVRDSLKTIEDVLQENEAVKIAKHSIN